MVLTEEQKESRAVIIERYSGEPDSEYEWGNVHFMVYDGMHIGIELDGYAHS